MGQKITTSKCSAYYRSELGLHLGKRPCRVLLRLDGEWGYLVEKGTPTVTFPDLSCLVGQNAQEFIRNNSLYGITGEQYHDHLSRWRRKVRDKRRRLEPAVDLDENGECLGGTI